MFGQDPHAVNHETDGLFVQTLATGIRSHDLGHRSCSLDGEVDLRLVLILDDDIDLVAVAGWLW